MCFRVVCGAGSSPQGVHGAGGIEHMVQENFHQEKTKFLE